MRFTAALAATLLAAATGAAASHPIVPPNIPSGNAGTGSCEERYECLAMINNIRADQEGLDAIHLPHNWDDLTFPERLFTFMNLERTSRGIAPLTWLVNTYDSALLQGILDDTDPKLQVIKSCLGGCGGVFAPARIPLGAMYMWFYNDGGSEHFGHRNIILGSDHNTAAIGSELDKNGNRGHDAMFFNLTSPPDPSEIILTWDEEKQHLA